MRANLPLVAVIIALVVTPVSVPRAEEPEAEDVPVAESDQGSAVAASEEPTEDPAANQVRMMYPEAKEPVSQFTLEGGNEMEFRDSSPKVGAQPKKKPRPIVEDDDPTREVYDEKKPRAL